MVEHFGLIGLIIALALSVGLAAAQSVENETGDSAAVDALQVEPVVESQAEPAEEIRADVRSADAVSLEMVDEFLRLGTLQLAHSVLDSHHLPREDFDKWVAWEKKFYEIAQRTQQWQSILERAGGVATDLPLELFIIAQTAAIRSEIELDRGEVARMRARHMIWNAPYDPESVIKWRELIMQSYIADGLYNDARLAMARFSQDYRPNDPQWEHQYARVLLVTGNMEEAVSRIAGLQTSESRMLNLYAQFIGNTFSPAEIVDRYMELLPEVEQDPALAAELWAIVRIVADAGKDSETEVIAAESGMLKSPVQRYDSLAVPLVPLTGTLDLLEAYDKHALEIGNSFGLIVGDDEVWHQTAQEYEILAPATARALYAFLSVNAQQPQWRNAAAEALATTLIGADLLHILETLVVDEKFLRLSDISSQDRNTLATRVLRKRDFRTALQIMTTMVDPPADIDSHSWGLRRARVALLAGEIETGISILRRLVEGLEPPLDGELIDRIVQVIFDLQDLEQHQPVNDLVGALYDKSTDALQKRELLHWSAESYSKTNQHLKAARLFFRSAAMGDDWNDDWGRSVQYRGAVELMEAGMYADARRIFSTLKQLTFDPRTRAVIDNRLKELSEREMESNLSANERALQY